MKKLRVISICCVLASIFSAFVFSSCSEQGALHTHTLTRVPAQQSYCLKEGTIEYWKCDECGKYFADEAAQEEISLEETVLPFKHRPVYVEGQEADGIFSCGSISHYRCSACGALFADEAATQPIDESDVYEQKTFTLTEARITNTASSAQTVRVYADYEEEYYDLAVTESTFVLRVFLGWEGDDINDVGQNIGGRVNLNIDTEENIVNTVNVIKSFRNMEYELLPYHALGEQKYAYLGREYGMGDVLADYDKVKALQRMADEMLGR